MNVILNRFFLFIFLAINTSFCTESVQNKTGKDKNSFQAPGLKVLELFTSEGCSSCPPADAILNKLVEEKRNDVFILTYHVDYWDRLGWKDSFSSPDFTKRQNLYAAQFNNQSIYTPQLIVNGSSEFTGSDEEKLKEELDKKNPPGNPAELEAEILTINKNKFTFKYSLPASRNQWINFALIQRSAVTKVKRGENGGRTLKHANIVRSIKSADLEEESKTTEIEFDIIPDPNNFFVIAFVQNKNDLKITKAMSLSLDL